MQRSSVLDLCVRLWLTEALGGCRYANTFVGTTITLRISYVGRGGKLLNVSLPIHHGLVQTSMGPSWMVEGSWPMIWRTLEKLSGKDCHLFSYVNVNRTLGTSVAQVMPLRPWVKFPLKHLRNSFFTFPCNEISFKIKLSGPSVNHIRRA